MPFLCFDITPNPPHPLSNDQPYLTTDLGWTAYFGPTPVGPWFWSLDRGKKGPKKNPQKIRVAGVKDPKNIELGSYLFGVTSSFWQPLPLANTSVW